MNRSTRTLLPVMGVLLGAATAFAEAPPRAEIQTMKSLPHRLSAPVSTFAPGLPAPATKAFALHKPDVPGGGNGRGGGGGTFTDPAVQTSYTSGFVATRLNSVEGIGANGSLPPDANIAVGDTQIVEVVNTQFAVYDKGGVLLPLGG